MFVLLAVRASLLSAVLSGGRASLQNALKEKSLMFASTQRRVVNTQQALKRV